MNGWVSKNVSYLLTDFTGVSNLVLLTNSTSYNLSNLQKLGTLGIFQGNCLKLDNIGWFGGYQSFNFRTKIIKTVFNLPPHQWVNIMFQAIMIDHWFSNTLLLEINS
jgi:hypothetical protein